MSQPGAGLDAAAASSGSQWSAAFASSDLAAARIYDDIMVPRMFEPWADLLLEQAGVKPGEALLDVACGTGSVTRRAAARTGDSGRVTGCDLSSAMLAVALSKPQAEGSAPIDYVECPADALAVADAAYDVATCQQGLQFFADRQRALREMRRALRPGGRLALAVWCAIDECPPFAGLAAAVAKVLGEQAAVGYRNGPWGLARADLAALVEQAGFTDVRVDRRQLPVTFDAGPRQLVQTLATTAVANSIAALGEAGQRSILAAAEDALAPLTDERGVRSALTTRIVIATANT